MGRGTLQAVGEGNATPLEPLQAALYFASMPACFETPVSFERAWVFYSAWPTTETRLLEMKTSASPASEQSFQPAREGILNFLELV